MRLIKMKRMGRLILLVDYIGQRVDKRSWTRRWSKFCVLFGIGVLLVSCSTPMSLSTSSTTSMTETFVLDAGATSAPRQTALDVTESRENQTDLGQVLPISAQTEIGDQIILLEVAVTPQEQALGLMYRTELADNRGMLFPFVPARPVSFWMWNVPISLDMIFLFQGAVVDIAADVPSCTTRPCPVYGPERRQLVDRVIELRGGRAAEIGIQVGDVITINPLDPAASLAE
ncbi:MAG: DUF192 domain-containing protein [Leptolyngbyaceae cyanobacterium MO_188.B28]|nr:DUF192 domain-containing protein [Leptolyngbyaceae cyanobacterium MO_188.B28]